MTRIDLPWSLIRVIRVIRGQNYCPDALASIFYNTRQFASF
jgi:hypothetical protein